MKSRIYRGFHNNEACGIFDLSTFHRWISKIYNNIKIIFFDFYFLLLSLIRFKLFYPLSKLFQTAIPPIRTMQIELRRNKIAYAFSTILVVNKNSILRKRYTFRIKKLLTAHGCQQHHFSTIYSTAYSFFAPGICNKCSPTSTISPAPIVMRRSPSCKWERMNSSIEGKSGI